MSSDSSNPLLSPAILFSPSHTTSIPNLLSDFTTLQISCILQDHTLATFLPPFTVEKRSAALSQWQDFVDEVPRGKRDIFYITATSPSHPSPNLSNNEKNEGPTAAVAVVTLVYWLTDTGRHRAYVEKLLVSPDYRQRGLARKLLTRMEETARQKGRTLLALDTEVGSPAESVYPRLGWKRIGEIPKYGISPRDGKTRVGEAFFWKDLEEGVGDEEEGGKGAS